MKKLYLPLALLLALSMLLAACGPQAPAEETPVVEEPVVEEPAVEEPMEEPMEETSDLSGVFATMLANMEGYNTVKADALLVEMAEDTPPFLLDVRTTAELEDSGHIEGATHIPLNELAQHMDLLPSFDTPIVAYCGTGWRATIAMTALYGMGWTDVRALKATYTDWVDAGNPVADGVPEEMALNVAEPDEALVAAADAYLVGIKDHGVKFGVTTAELFNTVLAENPDLVVIDVRRQDELEEHGVIEAPNFTHIPMESFVTESAKWPADKEAEIVIYCGSGHRSTMAMTILFANDYANVTSLSGGFSGWKEAGYPVVEYVAP